ncbi:polysaccharide biosynthesis protein [Paracrocinitomix mangrovi]|uniref:polysaccharide biosynthesis protein n=1 Tax=Paracrocinitomix mangrovi TaxID=2862509 RepID=UPI001C8D9B8D|nr:nucleoside-diphosphate sugar epimerase/dehydratase [Paracrocinitomix mangrovi]UKN02771.1 polysaccharide biosynthesis protein [Paracrocinitomix mangrovi]
MDLAIATAALLVAYMVRFDTTDLPIATEYHIFISGLPIYLLVRGVMFLIFGVHKGMLRHTATADVKKVILSTTLGTLVMVAISFFKFKIYQDSYLFPSSVIIVEYFVCISFLLVFRFAVKLVYMEELKRDKDQIPTVIYGAGTYGLITKHTVEKEAKLAGKIVCFIDDDNSKTGKSLEGLKIYNSKSLDKIIETHEIKRLIMAIKEPIKTNKRAVIDTCLANNVEILNVPLPTEWINGEFTTGQIKPIKIEDLLGRESIKLDSNRLKSEFKNKTILVTGAAGSIGSEIVRQLTALEPEKIIMLDQAESPLYNLEMELKEKDVFDLTESVIADIRNFQRVENVFNTFKPDIVFHAAAYKHVPLMEDNPSEAILTNVQGTKNLVDLSIEHKVNNFVLISTDKAVNPTNVMGCSKRIAEIYAQSANSVSDTKFITTRFGNVLGSNGSVIPLFKKQIEAGGPLTVTHEDITRFFMTIPEAVSLVLEAELMGEGKEIFVFDMGESVKIYDLAKKMIKLSGLELGKDIEIKITGLRPGEKLYEELLTNEENTLPTHHPQILVAKVREYDFEEISNSISELVMLFEYQNNEEIVKFMKWVVPEYRSNNSEFEKLDK